MKILIAPNSFKECISSVNLADLISSNLSPGNNIETIISPLSDGGDGFLKVVQISFGGVSRSAVISKPFNDDRFKAPYLYDEKKRKIYIETAEVCGLKLIPPNERKILYNSSKGLGEMIKQISSVNKLNADEIIIGIGGTGTNDLAMGALSQLGLKLFDKNGKELKALPVNFINVEKIDWMKPNLKSKLTLVVDVENPLLGKDGANAVFAPQKGASYEDINKLEEGFNNILRIASENNENLSGAGGGLAAGLKIFLNAKIIAAEEFILDRLQLKTEIEKSDLIITGEGKIDRQSFMNKGTGIVLNQAKKMGKKVFIICGIADESIFGFLPQNCKIIELRKYFSSKDESIKNIEKGISKACKEILAEL